MEARKSVIIREGVELIMAAGEAPTFKGPTELNKFIAAAGSPL